MYHEHRPGYSSKHQLVVAPSSGKQQQWPRGTEAHKTSYMDQPLLCADDLRRPHHPGISLQENATVHVRMLGVG